MFRKIHSLDGLNKANSNINQKNEKINNIKVGRRRKSDSLVSNLKKFSEQWTSGSTSLQDIETAEVQFFFFLILK